VKVLSSITTRSSFRECFSARCFIHFPKRFTMA